MPSVKTAISVERDLFERAERFARKLKISRSRLWGTALREYLERETSQRLLDQINAACEEDLDPEEERALRAMRAKFQKIADPWES